MNSLVPLPVDPAFFPVTPSAVPSDTLSAWCLEHACLMAAAVTRHSPDGPGAVELADGYPFSWGTLVERQSPGLVVWEFWLGNGLCPRPSGKGFYAMQMCLFDALEARLDCVSRRFVPGWPVLAGPGSPPWVFVPGGLGELVCPYGQNRACRAWLASLFIPRILPQCIEEANRHALQTH